MRRARPPRSPGGGDKLATAVCPESAPIISSGAAHAAEAPEASPGTSGISNLDATSPSLTNPTKSPMGTSQHGGMDIGFGATPLRDQTELCCCPATEPRFPTCKWVTAQPPCCEIWGAGCGTSEDTLLPEAEQGKQRAQCPHFFHLHYYCCWRGRRQRRGPGSWGGHHTTPHPSAK